MWPGGGSLFLLVMLPSCVKESASLSSLRFLARATLNRFAGASKKKQPNYKGDPKQYTHPFVEVWRELIVAAHSAHERCGPKRAHA
eukprot:SAG11_NODE_1550_length_4699_cov_6.841522_4_plen_86_part_00